MSRWNFLSLSGSRSLILLLILCSLMDLGLQQDGGDETAQKTRQDSSKPDRPTDSLPPHPRTHLHAMLRKISGSTTLDSESELQQCTDTRGVVETLEGSSEETWARADDGCQPCENLERCCGGCACEHGKCSDDSVCLCEADWFGDSCSFHALSDAFFLPRVDPRWRSRRRAQQAAHFTSSGEALVRDLDRMQHLNPQPGEHAEKRQDGNGKGDGQRGKMVVLMEGRGLGSWVHHMAGALTKAVSENKTLVLHYPYDYFLHEGCATRTQSQMELEDGSCYFEALVSGVSPGEMHEAAAAGGEQRLSDFWSHYAPPQAAAAAYGPAAGHLWWNVQLAGYLFTPNRRLEAAVRRYKRLLGWPAPGVPVLGVHVRHGDACASWRKGVMHHSELMGRAFCLNFHADVLPAIDLLRQRYSVEYVFISTDDPDVLAELAPPSAGDRPASDHNGEFGPPRGPRLPSGAAVRWLGGGAVRSFLQSDTNYDIGMRLGVLDRRLTADSAVLDALLLAEADCFLGQLSGEFSRLALELSVAQKGYLPPFISLDTYPWAPRYGLAAVPEWWRQGALSLEALIAIKRNVSVEQVQSELYSAA